MPIWPDIEDRIYTSNTEPQNNQEQDNNKRSLLIKASLFSISKYK